MRVREAAAGRLGRGRRGRGAVRDGTGQEAEGVSRRGPTTGGGRAFCTFVKAQKQLAT